MTNLNNIEDFINNNVEKISYVNTQNERKYELSQLDDIQKFFRILDYGLIENNDTNINDSLLFNVDVTINGKIEILKIFKHHISFMGKTYDIIETRTINDIENLFLNKYIEENELNIDIKVLNANTSQVNVLITNNSDKTILQSNGYSLISLYLNNRDEIIFTNTIKDDGKFITILPNSSIEKTYDLDKMQVDLEKTNHIVLM